MKKMYKEILKQIYYGEFYPDEQIIPDNPEYHEKTLQIGDEFGYFMEIAKEEDKARIERLQALIADVHSIDRYENFAYGFSAGLQLMHEVNQMDNKSDICQSMEK